ncbi:uncharacterized protein I206_101134 [Kwoniella pini CBS 10737]|uniref:Major facilitator superfamily (MFS) profile domain-containing protein n=1 Tax=Kwoniella pini CBS 10737 TaxID=1296096 RepID=A0AAJ8KZB5_9TREE
MSDYIHSQEHSNDVTITQDNIVPLEQREESNHVVPRLSTIASSTATLCMTDTEYDEVKPDAKDKEVLNSTGKANGIEQSTDTCQLQRSQSISTTYNAHTNRTHNLAPRNRSQTIAQPAGRRKVSLRRSSTLDDGPPPPIPAPGDVIAVLDPASVGGGGPLKRVETARSERYEQEAAERLQREANGSPRPNSGSEGILRRFRSASNTTTKRPIFNVPLGLHDHHEHDDEENSLSGYKLKFHKPTLTPTHSRKSSAVNSLAASEDGKEGGHTSTDSEKGQGQNHGDIEIQQQINFEDHVYPDGGYGWIVLISCVVLAGCTMGWNMNYGVFQEYYASNVFSNTKTSILILPGCLNGFMMNFSAFLSGRMGDRYGFNRVLYASAGIFWLGLFLASWSTKLWQLIFTQGVIAGFGQGLALPLFMSLPSQWFYRRRGLASGIAIGGAGLGGGTITLVARQLLSTVGYKKTLLILSFVELFFMLLATFFLRTRPTSPEARSGKTAPWVDKEVVKTGAFWSIMIGTVVGTTGYAMPFAFLAQYVRANFPISDPILLALPTTLLAYTLCIGRALVGFVADKIGPLNTYILVFVISGIIQFALWLTAKTFGGVLAFAVMFGLIAPGFSGILPQIIVQLFGPANLATNVGLILLSGAPGNLINGPIGGGIYDSTNRTTFKYTIIFGGAMQIAGGIIACYARYKTSRKFLVKV